MIKKFIFKLRGVRRLGKNNVVLIGFMGTGKSTVGKALSARLNWQFVDTDLRIEQNEGMTISEIFHSKGESAFREAESETIEAVLQGENQVIATGGGAVLAERNRLKMKQDGFVVALTATAETSIERIKQDENRPLVQGNVEERVHTLLEIRKYAYDFADLKIDTSSISVDEIVERITAAIF
jgi:shikimate kinase